MMIDLLFSFLVGGGVADWHHYRIWIQIYLHLISIFFFFIWMIETRMQKCFAVCLPIILCLVNV